MTSISHIAIDMQHVIGRYLTRAPNPTEPYVILVPGQLSNPVISDIMSVKHECEAWHCCVDRRSALQHISTPDFLT